MSITRNLQWISDGTTFVDNLLICKIYRPIYEIPL